MHECVQVGDQLLAAVHVRELLRDGVAVDHGSLRSRRVTMTPSHPVGKSRGDRRRGLLVAYRFLLGGVWDPRDASEALRKAVAAMRTDEHQAPFAQTHV